MNCATILHAWKDTFASMKGVDDRLFRLTYSPVSSPSHPQNTFHVSLITPRLSPSLVCLSSSCIICTYSRFVLKKKKIPVSLLLRIFLHRCLESRLHAPFPLSAASCSSTHGYGRTTVMTGPVHFWVLILLEVSEAFGNTRTILFETTLTWHNSSPNLFNRSLVSRIVFGSSHPTYSPWAFCVCVLGMKLSTLPLS